MLWLILPIIAGAAILAAGEKKDEPSDALVPRAGDSEIIKKERETLQVERIRQTAKLEGAENIVKLAELAAKSEEFKTRAVKARIEREWLEVNGASQFQPSTEEMKAEVSRRLAKLAAEEAEYRSKIEMLELKGSTERQKAFYWQLNELIRLSQAQTQTKTNKTQVKQKSEGRLVIEERADVLMTIQSILNKFSKSGFSEEGLAKAEEELREALAQHDYKNFSTGG